MSHASAALIIILSSFLIFSLSIHTVGAQSYQTWSVTVSSSGGSHTGTLNVDSNGDFTASGFTGSSSSGTYTIYVNGYMSGSSISFTESASYDGGSGQISGNGDGTLNAQFPSATYASGTISGTISDPLGTRSFTMSFTASKTSGGGGGGGGGDIFSGGIDDTTLVIAGAVSIVFVVLVVSVARGSAASRKAKERQRMQASMGPMHHQAPPQMRESHPRNYQYGQPNPPTIQGSTIQGGMIPPPISMDNGIPITGQGASVAPIELGSLPFLNALWEPGKASLSWGTPQFDQSKYALLGYDLYQQTYGPTNTAAQSILMGRVPPGTNGTVVQPFNQTYQWNTGGDVAGFRVDPVFGQLNGQGQVVNQFHFGGLGVKVGQPFGTFGVGP